MGSPVWNPLEQVSYADFHGARDERVPRSRLKVKDERKKDLHHFGINSLDSYPSDLLSYFLQDCDLDSGYALFCRVFSVFQSSL
jgi:hypothetical protein